MGKSSVCFLAYLLGAYFILFSSAQETPKVSKKKTYNIPPPQLTNSKNHTKIKNRLEENWDRVELDESFSSLYEEQEKVAH